MRRRKDGEAPDIIFYFLIDLINAKAKVNSLKLYLYFNTAIKFMPGSPPYYTIHIAALPQDWPGPFSAIAR